jgi:hypothetical protein
MPWYAVDALDDALDETESLLLPFDLGTWVRLAIISIFAGMSAPQTPTFSWDLGPGTTVRTGDQVIEHVTSPEFVALLLGIAAVLLVAVAVFAFVGSVMEFVLVDVVRSRDVRVLAPFRERLRPGLQLFLFRTGLVVATLLAVGTILVPIWLAAVGGTPVWLLLLVVSVPLTLVVGVLSAVASEFTTAFVVPLMIETESGLLAAWRQFWPTLRAEWKEFGVYVLVKLVVLVGAGFLLGIAGAIVAVPLGVFVFAGAFTPLAFVAVGVATLLGLVVTAAVSVPVVTYIRYHSLCTLDAAAVEFSLR